MNILVPLANGVEEIEAITNIDVLRRANINVITAALEKKEVKGSHDIIIKTDINISDIDPEKIDGIFLPGGMPGAVNLKRDKRVIEIIQQMDKENKLLSAICAAPIVLEKAGVLKGKNATSYPGFQKDMPSCNYMEDRVVIDGNIITGRGPGVAMEFALALVRYILGEEDAEKLKNAMLVK